MKLESFLAEQIAQRIRFGLTKETSEEEAAASQQAFVLVDGLYDGTPGARRFRFSVLSLKPMEPRETILHAFRTVHSVLSGYRFNDYDQVEVLDYLNRQKLVLDRQVLLDYQQKKITEQEILDRFLSESQSVQEAFKLFGFNLTDPSDPNSPPVATATP